MKVSFEVLQQQFLRVLRKHGFTESKATLCARIFAENSRDGVYSHGLNRFPVFIKSVEDGLVVPSAEPVTVSLTGSLEQWDGQLAPGMYTATLAMQRAIQLAKEHGIGCVAVRNTNHWMRGGTHGLLAAEAGCIGICSTNTIANMPPWGGTQPRLGNNPFVIAIPREEGPIVLDMAMTQYSYGKLQEYKLKGQKLPYDGGYDEEGNLSKDPAQITDTQRTLPIGFWKGSGLSLVLDMLVASLSGGSTVGQITAQGAEYGVSQFFLCIKANQIDSTISQQIIDFAKSSTPVEEGGEIYYPGEHMMATRVKNTKEGIPVNEEIWNQVLMM